MKWPRVRLQAPVEQDGTLGPAVRMFDDVEVEKVERMGRVYEFWKGRLDIGGGVTGEVMLSVLDERGQEVDVAFF